MNAFTAQLLLLILVFLHFRLIGRNIEKHWKVNEQDEMLIDYEDVPRIRRVFNEALKCMNTSQSPYGTPQSKLLSREERYKHFIELKEEFNNHFINVSKMRDCYAGYCGPWEEQVWKTKYENASFDTFGPFVPLFIPFVFLWRHRNSYLKQLTYVFSKLRPDMLYITVTQNDDGIEGGNGHVDIPPNLFILSGGGKGHIPIMMYKGELPVSPINETCNFKYDYCFAGSIKYRINRAEIIKFFKDKYGKNKKFIATNLRGDAWKRLFEKCKIIISPRGWARNTFRLNEVLQMGLINYYISNEIWIPYEGTWVEKEHLYFSSKLKDMDNVTNFIDKMTCEEHKEIRRKIIKHIPTHFNKDGFFNQIVLFMKYGFSVSDLRCNHYYTYH